MGRLQLPALNTPQTAGPNLPYAEYDSLEFRVLMLDPPRSLRGAPPDGSKGQASKSRWTWGRSFEFGGAPKPQLSPRRKPGPIFQRPACMDPGFRRGDTDQVLG